MPREHIADAFSQQARACALLGSPLYAALLGRLAQDIHDGGPGAEAVAGYEAAPVTDALPLRLLGAAHALALTGRAPALAAHYPSAGGVFDPAEPAAGWPALRAVIATEQRWIREWLTRAPQTNEIGRAHLLLAALLHLVPTVQLPLRLFELGASAGLNLRVEQFRYSAPHFTWGPVDSSVHLTDTWLTEVPDWLRAGADRHQTLRIVERRGCDPSPIDPLSADGSLALRAYIWPDQPVRMDRLDGALRIAAKVPATVESASAAEFLAGVELEPGTLTVVWHSVMQQYVPAAEWAKVEWELDRLVGQATPEAGFARASFEPRLVAGVEQFWLTVQLGDAPEELLAVAHAHGVPAGWPGQLG